MPKDLEIAAISRVIRTLEALEPSVRERVARFLIDKFERTYLTGDKD